MRSGIFAFYVFLFFITSVSNAVSVSGNVQLVDIDGILTSASNAQISFYPHTGATAVDAVCSAGGDYTANLINLTTYSIYIQHPDAPLYTNEFTTGNTVSENRNFVLPPGAVLSGFILDDSDRPLPGVQIEAFQNSGTARAVTFTGSDGRFDCGMLPEGDWFVRAKKNGYADISQSGVWIYPHTSRLFYTQNTVVTESTQSFGLKAVSDLKAVDLNNDGYEDLLFAQEGQPDEVYINQPGAAFLAGWRSSVNDFTLCVDAADIDADGWLDFVTAGDDETIKFYRNDHAGSFDLLWQSLNRHQILDLKLHDLNTDGIPELVVVEERKVEVFEFISGNFVSRWVYTGLDSCSAISVADVAGNTLPDLIVGRMYASNRIYENQASFFFSAGFDFARADSTVDIVTADVDGNGFMDILFGNFKDEAGLNGMTDWEYQGYGSGAWFTKPAGQIMITSAMALADFDTLTGLDLLKAGPWEPARIYSNNTIGSFSYPFWQNSRVFKTRALAVADFDHNGYPDFVLGNQGATCLKMKMGPGGTYQGYLRDAVNRQGLENYEVRISNGASTFRIGITGSGGRFRIDRLTPGVYRLQVQKTGYASILMEGLVIVAEGVLDLGDIFLNPIGQISGYLAMADSTPASGHRVFLEPEE